MSDENKAVLRRFYDEFFNGGNLDVADEIIAPDCPLYFGSMFMGNGPEAFKQTRTMMYGGFPDLHLTIEEMVAEGEKVAERLSARGTHEGEFMDVAPTGQRAGWQGHAGHAGPDAADRGCPRARTVGGSQPHLAALQDDPLGRFCGEV
jgi:predicted ester cyclase